MKKFFSLLCAIGLVKCFDAFPAIVANADDISVKVSISIGELVLAQETVNVHDVDSDGKITINDALYLAHKLYYSNNEKSGYAYENTEYGISMTRLWGIENGGSYGYFCNNIASSNLADEIHDGDFIAAYAYSDLTTWSDTYTYFNVNTIESSTNSDVKITLNSAGYDANWQPITLPVQNADITMDGVPINVKTDMNGSAVVHADMVGEHIISAKLDGKIIVPPSCRLIVKQADTSNLMSQTKPVKTGDDGIMLASLGGLFGLIVCYILGKKNA